jgi:hypothetical protein
LIQAYTAKVEDMIKMSPDETPKALHKAGMQAGAKALGVASNRDGAIICVGVSAAAAFDTTTKASLDDIVHNAGVPEW